MLLTTSFSNTNQERMKLHFLAFEFVSSWYQHTNNIRSSSFPSSFSDSHLIEKQLFSTFSFPLDIQSFFSLTKLVACPSAISFFFHVSIHSLRISQPLRTSNAITRSSDWLPSRPTGVPKLGLLVGVPEMMARIGKGNFPRTNCVSWLLLK